MGCMGHPAPWFRLLLGLRDAVMAGFGIKTSSQMRRAAAKDPAAFIDFFHILWRSDREIVVGENDRRLDFRVSRLLRAAPDEVAHELVVTTVASRHNRLGRIYLALIAPFHRFVVKAHLRRMAARRLI